MLKVGDRVIAHKPEDVSELPYWEPEMDQYNGKEYIIESIEYNGTICLEGVLVDDYYHWKFNSNWLELTKSIKKNVKPGYCSCDGKPKLGIGICPASESFYLCTICKLEKPHSW